jgi:hypothetical protein
VETVITVKCVGCKATKNLTEADCAKIDGCPTCEKCGMPMVIHSAKLVNPKRRKAA